MIETFALSRVYLILKTLSITPVFFLIFPGLVGVSISLPRRMPLKLRRGQSFLAKSGFFEGLAACLQGTVPTCTEGL